MKCRSLALLGMTGRLLGMTAVIALFSAGPALAQCPDGSPPPCAGQRVASAGRPANPPLDDRTWIVMPFDNLSNGSDVEWLRAASANLLYLDMSRWQDIRVVDDERVADLVRETPAAQGPALSLASALAIARRAGAGKLVMGDVIKAGNRTMLTAKVFDVRNGQRTNTIRDETTVQDSVIPLFGRLARRILRVDPPPGSSVGMVGTNSILAYQAYSQGVQALNRFDLASAKESLRRAIQLDSTFALAHFKLATTLGWFEGGDPRRLDHAEASWRFGNTLPKRERTLIEAQLWHIRGDLVKSRDLYAAGVAADSSDIEAWHGLGETSYHDVPVIRDATDTSRVRFRGDWNLATRAFERVLALDPSYHVAFPHIIDMLEATYRRGCLLNAENRCIADYIAIVRLEGDSIVTTPMHLAADSARLRQSLGEFVRQGGRRTRLARADEISLRWLNVATTEWYAMQDRAALLSQLGRLKEATDLLARGRTPGTGLEQALTLALRLELALKSLNLREARRLYDSVRTVPEAAQVQLPFADGSGATSLTLYGWLARNFGWTFGHFVAAEPVLRGFGTAPPSPILLRYRRAFARLMAGMPDSLAAAEQALFTDVVSRSGPAVASRNLAASYAYGLNAPRAKWVPIDTSLRDIKLRPALALLQKDRAALRTAARQFDSTSRAMTAAFVADTAYSLIAVEAYLAAGDSLLALNTLRHSLDSTLVRTQLLDPVATSGTVLYAATLPRLMLQRADLAAALGEPAEARLWYGRFLDLWATTDAEVQPIVARARRALAVVGGGQ